MAKIISNITFDRTGIVSPITWEKENILQLGKGGTQRAPPARASSSGGCRPPTPPLSFFIKSEVTIVR